MKIGRKIAKLQMHENVHKNVNENMYSAREKHILTQYHVGNYLSILQQIKIRIFHLDLVLFFSQYSTDLNTKCESAD